MGGLAASTLIGGVGSPIKSVLAQGERPAIQRKPFANAVGWAYSARIDAPHGSTGSPCCVLDDLRYLRELGCNTLYVGHANPARWPEPDGVEPGLCYAVYHALVGRTRYQRDAERVVAALSNVLDAAESLGLQVVLPVGYQIQMGDEWSDAYPSEVRKFWDGEDLNHWGEPGTRTASPYSRRYWQDITTYYRWVHQTFVRRYPNIVALNLADEPMGADCSIHAQAEFRREYGAFFKRAPQRAQGEFLAGVLADYASMSAQVWQEIDPSLWTMMTFHIQREQPLYPDFEMVFQLAPPSFIFSADTHWHDGPPDGGLNDEEFLALQLLCRTLGWLSAVYDRRLMPWTGANAWSLAYSEYNAAHGIRYGGVKEALDNFKTVNEQIRRMGGQIAFIMGWGFIRGQEMPGFREHVEAVSREMSRVKGTLSEPISGQTTPDCIITYDLDRVHEMVGALKVDHWLDVNLRERLESLGYDFQQIVRDRQSVVLKCGGRAFQRALAANPRALVIPIV